MSRVVFVLANDEMRSIARNAITQAPQWSRVELKGKRRTNDQNAKFWAMMTELSNKRSYHGRMMSPRRWARLFVEALDREAVLIPNLDNTGTVDVGRSTSDLDTRDFSDLIEIVYEWASRQGVTFYEPALEAHIRK